MLTNPNQPWDESHLTPGSVGKLFPNITARYMLPSGSPAPPGTPGELWLSGPNVFSGYWNNPSATSSSLTSDGYFKTGDVGFQDDQGNFYITDRVKELIKYKGFQAAPAELEAKMMQCGEVGDVAVIGVMDEQRGTEVPRAYVVPATKGDAQVEDYGEKEAQSIIKWVEERVANHKRLRGGVVFVKEVPKSASGKILRRVLKDGVGGDRVFGLEGGGRERAKL